MEKISGSRLKNVLGEHPMTQLEYRKYESAIYENYEQAVSLSEKIKKAYAKSALKL